MLKKVVEEVEIEKKSIYALGWIPKNKEWAAKTIAEEMGFQKIKHVNGYFGRFNVYCEECQKECECDAEIWMKK